MNKCLLILSLFLVFVFFCSGGINAAVEKPSFLIKTTTTVTERAPVFEIVKRAKSEKKLFKPFAINVEDSKAMTKFVTPNGDKKNDSFVFQCYNPMDLFVSGKIYSLKSRLVAKMQNADVSSSDNYSELAWDPNSGAEKAKGGVYIYQIIIGDKVYRGTVIVIR